MAIIYNPNILPESADPQGSTRYGNVNIIHEQIECKHSSVTYYDNIADSNTFIVEDKSPEFDGYETHIFKGVVVKEDNGTYNWWRSINEQI